eukprot:UN24009
MNLPFLKVTLLAPYELGHLAEAEIYMSCTDASCYLQ